MDALPDDLLEYLTNMINPSHVGGQILFVDDPSAIAWSDIEDDAYHGAIVCGDVAAYTEEIWRVVKPGAHVLTVAPDDEPTGHTGACALEDKGFEVRDAILLVDEPNKYHYVPKPSQRERHAGCEQLKHLKIQRAQEEESLDEESEAADVPLDANAHKGNVHPTVKPKAIMAHLLADVPKDAPIIDPFMGSGTTMLACLDTGHDAIGIEMQDEYIEIATTRVKYWDRASVGDGATIESDHKPVEVEQEPTDFFDFLD